ncbi:MAG: response regulator [Sphingosinicella sp.]|nr:response regulator [Sphingosinicella sp.]
MILIVDDDKDVRGMIKRALHELGYPATEASNGEKALAIMAEEMPDLVILDYIMPGMDGTEVAREIAKIDPALPIIFSTGHGALRALRNAAGENISILEKPFALNELSELIESRLAERRRVAGAALIGDSK